MPQALIVGGYANRSADVRTYIGQLNGTANFDRPSLMPRGTDRKQAVAQELYRVNNNAMQGAQPQLDALKAQGLLVSYTVNPLSNTVVMDVPDARAAEAWKAINAVEGMGAVVRNREVKLAPIEDVKEGAKILMTVPDSPAAAPSGIEWNVSKVHAPEVWAQGYTGQGVTVGIIDTGVDVNHENVKAKYRGTQADGSFDDNYNFFDAVNGKTGAYDDNAHGTHVTGTVLGSTPDGSYHTGMAPDAKFIASKILSGQGSGSLEGVTRGLEWMLAPRDSQGQNPDPTKAPDIVSNSWGTNDGRLAAFRNIAKAFLAAGIEPVFAAGNSGPRAGSVGAPGSYPEVISVAATDKNDKVASFSSRGPSPIKDDNGSDRKPDIAAPGHQITSSIPGGGYATYSGTSMATPGVSGVIALLLSKYKDLTHDEIVKAITTSAVDVDAPGYDYNSGYGRIDAEAALKAADAIVAARAPKA